MGLQENVLKETVVDLDVRKAVAVEKTTTLKTVVQKMRDADIGCVVVVDDREKPVGIFTESMLAEQLSHGEIPVSDCVEKHMSVRFPWVRNSDPIADVVSAMELKNTRLLVVLDENDRVLGITGQRGVMEYIADHFPGQVMVQRVGQSPFLSDREGA